MDATPGQPTISGTLTSTYPDKVTLTANITKETDSDFSYEYQWLKDGEIVEGQKGETLEISNVADSGAYTVKAIAKCNGGEFASLESESSTVTIAPADITGTITQKGALGYTGQPLTAEIESTLAAKNNQVVTVKYGTIEGQCTSSTVPGFTDVGKHTVYYVASALNHNDYMGSFIVNVSKGVPTITKPTAKELTYDGTAQALVNAGKVPSGAKIQYSLEKTGTYKDAIPTGTDAKEYTVWYKVVGGTNYEDTEAQFVTVTIAQKDIAGATVILVNKLTYTGTEVTQNVKSVEIDGLTVTYDVSKNTVTNAGKHNLTITGKGNFKGTVTQEFEVAKAESTVTKAPKAKELTYTGLAQALVTAAETSDGTIKYSLKADTGFATEIPQAKDAKEYKVYYKVMILSSQ